MAEKSMSFSITDGKNFFADEVSVTNNPLKFILDFKSAAPRIDIRAEQQGIPIVIEHNVIIMDAWLAKTFHKILGNHIEKYEDQFGEIIEPKQLVKAKEQHEITTTEQRTPGYFG